MGDGERGARGHVAHLWICRQQAAEVSGNRELEVERVAVALPPDANGETQFLSFSLALAEGATCELMLPVDTSQALFFTPPLKQSARARARGQQNPEGPCAQIQTRACWVARRA